MTWCPIALVTLVALCTCQSPMQPVVADDQGKEGSEHRHQREQGDLPAGHPQEVRVWVGHRTNGFNGCVSLEPHPPALLSLSHSFHCRHSQPGLQEPTGVCRELRAFVNLGEKSSMSSAVPVPLSPVETTDDFHSYWGCC